MRRRVFLARSRGSKVAEHVVEAFRARMEVALNGICYLREEQLKTRNALESTSVDLYVKGVKRRNGLPWVRSAWKQSLTRRIARAKVRTK